MNIDSTQAGNGVHESPGMVVTRGSRWADLTGKWQVSLEARGAPHRGGHLPVLRHGWCESPSRQCNHLIVVTVVALPIGASSFPTVPCNSATRSGFLTPRPGTDLVRRTRGYHSHRGRCPSGSTKGHQPDPAIGHCPADGRTSPCAVVPWGPLGPRLRIGVSVDRALQQNGIDRQ